MLRLRRGLLVARELPVRLLLWVWLPTRLLIWWRRLAQPTRRPPESAPKSIILFRLDALGDVVLTTPLFRELKRAFPGSRLTVVVQRAYASILETNPNIDELLTLPVFSARWLPAHTRRLFAAISLYRRELSGRHFDLAITPRWDTDEHLAAFLCLLTNARVRAGYSEAASAGKKRYNRGFDGAFDLCLDPGPLQHEVERNLGFIAALGGRVREKHLEIDLLPKDHAQVRQVLRDLSEECAVLALGIGAQTPGRRWRIEHYAAVIRELAMQYPLYIVIVCAPSERPEARRLQTTLPVPAFISDGPNIRETCVLLARCELFIGNDTGSAHLAAAMQCPTIVISRHPGDGDPAHPNSPVRFAPWCDCSRVLQPEHGLDQCTERCLRDEPHCIEQVSVAEVALAAKTMLMQSQRAHDKLGMSCYS